MIMMIREVFVELYWNLYNFSLISFLLCVKSIKQTVIANNLYLAPEEVDIEDALLGEERSASVRGSDGFNDSGSKSTNGKRTGVLDFIQRLLYGWNRFKWII